MQDLSHHMILLVNFGGPRNLEEIPSFLTELLQDPDVIRTKLPTFLHNWIFGRVARKRAKKIAHDYLSIGGKSPIYFDTETLAEELRCKTGVSVMTFHRYLPATHQESLQKIEEAGCKEILVLPLFPQFSYATTGSIARFFSKNFSCKAKRSFRWIKSYAGHPAFIQSYQHRLATYLEENGLLEEETFFLFSAHGLPQSFVCQGDLYQTECELSYEKVMEKFPKAKSILCYQSKFGPGEWLRPYTDETCASICNSRKNVVVVPISFTSDHIETLFEIEQLYLPVLREKGVNAYRCPALNLEPYWIDALAEIVKGHETLATQMLIRNEAVSWCCSK